MHQTLSDTGSSSSRYSSVAILLHWLIAAALAGQIALGFSMPRDASGFELYQLHKSVGITLLVLSLLRLVWRFTHPRPAPMEGGLGGFAAKAVHVGFYAFMILGPLTGWALVSTSAIQVPTLIFGIIPLPHLPLAGDAELWEEVHEYLAFMGIGLFVLHVAGALRHHFLLRDGLLARMAPGGKSGMALALGAVVVAIWAAVTFLVEPAGASNEPAVEQPEIAGPAIDEAPVAEPALAETEAAIVDEQAEAEAATEAEAEAESAPPPEWAIRPGGSLRFSVDNSGNAINGSFSSWNGDITLDPADPSTARIAMRIDLASARLGDATQDTMLQSGEFFATSANPTATWRSTRVTATGNNRYRAEGTLSLKGASRPQALTFTLSGSGSTRNVTGRATIDRNAFSVGTGDNAAGLDGSVTLEFAFDATS